MGTKARGGITLYNVKNGADAEYYRLQPQSEKAVVGVDNALYVTLSYIIEHVNGAQVTTEAGSAQGYHVTARMNNGVTIAMTNGAVNSGTYKLTNYSKVQNRPDYVIIELRDSTNKVVDIRPVQIIMEAASYVEVVGDLRRTVSQQGSSISSVQQDAKSLTLKVESLKNGVRNLLKGGRLGVTSSQYGFGAEKIEDRWVKLKPDTDYTLTACGRISGNAKANGQELRVYLFNHSDTDSTKEWTWQNVVRIGTEEDSVESIVVHTPLAGDRRRPADDRFMVLCYPYPNQDSNGRNGEVTVNWVTITEGTQPASDWIPSKEESGEERVKTVEARLENGEFRVKSDRTVFVDGSGRETVLIKDGKLSAELIDAVKIVVAGLQAGNIDAKNATIKNLIVEGNSTFNGTIKTEDGTIAGWKIKHGAIGYGADYDGLSILDSCLIYNYKNRERQVIVGEDPLSKISYGADTMLALRNNTRGLARNIGVLIDVAPDKSFVYRDNFAIFAARGTYAGFRRKLVVVSDNYTIKKEDSSILFTGRSNRLFTLPSDPEDGEEFTIYSAFGEDIDLKTYDGMSINGEAIAPRITMNGFSSKVRCTYRIVFSMLHKAWFIFVQ